jgi:CheY-like chemotaxis protein
MPRLDGSEAAERIRSGHEEGIDPHVPIIALTAYARQEEIETIEQSGIDSVVTKPVDIQHLSEEMRKLLSGKRHLKIEN